jgi:hypothetical protein
MNCIKVGKKIPGPGPFPFKMLQNFVNIIIFMKFTQFRKIQKM